MRTSLAKNVMLVTAATAVAAIAVATASSAGVTAIKVSSALGSKILVTSNGLALYHYIAEEKGTIACTGACAKLWLPLLASGSVKPQVGPGLSAAKLGTIKRPEGTLQLTYNGLALYRYASDKAGQTKGQGLNGKWFAVTPAGSVTKATGTTSGGGASSGGTSSGGAGTSSGGGSTGPLPTVTCNPAVVVTDPNDPCYNTAH